MNATDTSVLWVTRNAAPFIAIPSQADTKYSRGVLGIATGSPTYPGAAVLGVEAALRTGVGMIRYLGPDRASDLVLARRPEVVTAPGRVNAWLIGSGMDAQLRVHEESLRLQVALTSGCPVVIDAGALDLVSTARGPAVITPHARELATMLIAVSGAKNVEALAADIASNSAVWALKAADHFNVTVLLKGHTTHIASPADERGARFHARVQAPTTWLATAGTGDVLAGILGALVATHADHILADPELLGPLAATAALLHGLAAEHVSQSGPLVALDVAQAASTAVTDIL
jgi:NAD(P)H-hydrate repair Nnr-like enzyme with NAD(P)H-hydrate dehydratase domain